MSFRTKQVFTLPNGVEAELSIVPEDYLRDEIIVRKLDGGQGNYLIGMILQDHDCESPEDNDDYFGHIWHHPRSRYGKSDGYYAALGLDREGDSKVDEEKLQQMWHDAVMRLSLQDFFVTKALRDICDAEDLRQLLAEEYIVGDYGFVQDALSAWSVRLEDAQADDIEALIDQVEERLDWDYQKAWLECVVPMDRYAVLIDIYDHGQRAYSVSGGGMQCRWDTSRGAAVWVANALAREIIDSQAAVLKFGQVVNYDILRGPGPKFGAVAKPYGQPPIPLGRFENYWEALTALSVWARDNAAEATPEMAEAGFQEALFTFAEAKIDEYDKWQRGECYGVATVEVTPEGEEVEADSTYGIIGMEWAMAELLTWIPDNAVTP